MRKPLREARSKKNLTQQQVADAAGIDRTAYVHIEGGRNPSFKVAAKIAGVLEQPIEKLFPEFFMQTSVLKKHKTGTDA